MDATHGRTFPTRRLARLEAQRKRRIFQAPEWTVQPFYCDDCTGWHVDRRKVKDFCDHCKNWVPVAG